MSVAAIGICRDERDVVEYTVRHLASQVDEVLIADHGSSDGTYEKLVELADDVPLVVSRLDDPGYHQSAFTSALAQDALVRGHDWVVVCDQDEYWYSPHGRIGDVLDALPAEVLFARAHMWNHVASGEDPPDEPNPFARLGWHFREQGAMSKVACRTSPELEIDMGNHEATSTGRVRSNWQHTAYEQLWIHHFPWRSEAQLQRKLRNGARAYAAAPDLDPTYGEHWKAFGNPDADADFDERVAAWFWEWGYRASPSGDEDLIYDPAVGAVEGEAA